MNLKEEIASTTEKRRERKSFTAKSHNLSPQSETGKISAFFM